MGHRFAPIGRNWDEERGHDVKVSHLVTFCNIYLVVALGWGELYAKEQSTAKQGGGTAGGAENFTQSREDAETEGIVHGSPLIYSPGQPGREKPLEALPRASEGLRMLKRLR